MKRERGVTRQTAGSPAPPPATTADALIEAGRRIFARHGYDGSSVRAITREAGANLGAVTYHFGSKRALYNAVVARVMEPFVTRVVAASEVEGSAADRIGAIVRTFFEHLSRTPEVPFLMMQELAAGRRPPPPATAALRKVFKALRCVVEEGQAEGSIRPGDPVLMVLSIIAQPIHLGVARRAVQALTGLDMDEAATRERVLAHAVEFAVRGLQATPEEGA